MKTSEYAKMNISELSRVTRERGLKKPNVRTRADWVAFLEKDDTTRSKEAVIEGDGKGHKLPDLTDENADEEKMFVPSDEADTEGIALKTESGDTPNTDIDTLKVSKRSTKEKR